MTMHRLREVTVSPFQRRVFAVVKRIPKGEVRSYQWVARRLGNPQLARAVGQALRRNPWPIRVPCHRVVRADGSLGGYAWGAAKKRRLLKREGA
ncbi:MAG: MGMT family protein [Candidatus Omnitrophica bacterium]|nr:MGMT family protein [Candidatus Omnitrophota bacterium]